MNKIIGLILMLALAGCVTGCSTVPQVETHTVTNTVKVPVPCNPKTPGKPASAVDTLPLNAEIDEQMRALRADRVRGKAYSEQLEKALSSCS